MMLVLERIAFILIPTKLFAAPLIEFAFRGGLSPANFAISGLFAALEFAILFIISRKLLHASPKVATLGALATFLIIQIYIFQSYSLTISNNFITKTAFDNIDDYRLINWRDIYIEFALGVGVWGLWLFTARRTPSSSAKTVKIGSGIAICALLPGIWSFLTNTVVLDTIFDPLRPWQKLPS